MIIRITSCSENTSAQLALRLLPGMQSFMDKPANPIQVASAEYSADIPYVNIQNSLKSQTIPDLFQDMNHRGFNVFLVSSELADILPGEHDIEKELERIASICNGPDNAVIMLDYCRNDIDNARSTFARMKFSDAYNEREISTKLFDGCTWHREIFLELLPRPQNLWVKFFERNRILLFDSS